jgi:hypothetical protein
VSQSVDEILEAIRNLPLKEALVYLVAHGIANFVGKGFEKIKKVIQDKQNESRYAFVPNKEEANHLLNFAKDPSYREVLMLVPKYRYIDLIRTGLLIDLYHKNDSQINRERVGQIKLQITRRPNGKQLLKIANLPTTPFFSVILKRLHQLKLAGYGQQFLEETFDELIQTWTETSKLVQTEDDVDGIISFCKQQISKRSETFFVLGMKSASLTVEDALGELVSKKILDKNNYAYVLTKSRLGNTPRIELMVYAKEI